MERCRAATRIRARVRPAQPALSQRTPGEDQLPVGDEAVEIVMGQFGRLTREAEDSRSPAGSHPAPRLRSPTFREVGEILQGGVQIHRKAIAPAVLVERTRPDTSASQAQDYRAALGAWARERIHFPAAKFRSRIPTTPDARAPPRNGESRAPIRASTPRRSAVPGPRSYRSRLSSWGRVARQETAAD